jgi:hypothetical protein
MKGRGNAHALQSLVLPLLVLPLTILLQGLYKAYLPLIWLPHSIIAKLICRCNAECYAAYFSR